MSDDLELEAIERKIRDARVDGAADGGALKLQRLYLERERLQEKQFKRSLSRRARLNGTKR